MSIGATGIVRNMDDLGRVVLPKEIRRRLKLREGEPLELFLEESGGLITGILLRKYSPKIEIARDIKNMIVNVREKNYGIIDGTIRRELLNLLEEAEQLVERSN